MEETGRTMESVSDDILQKAQADVAELLKDKKLSKTDRTQLEVQSYFLMFLVNDHKKINKMYPFYEEQKKLYERRRAWWDKLQWVVIPLVVSMISAFAYQVGVFYFRIVPMIEQLGK